MRYAAQTNVSESNSKAEIERTLSRYGAQEFAYGWGNGQAMVAFKYLNRLIRFILPLPTEQEVNRTPKGRLRHGARQLLKARDQSTRQRWRALNLGIKAKLEFVESGITSFEQEFLAHIVLSSGQTFGEWVSPQLQAMYSGDMPRLLPGPIAPGEIE